MPRKEQPKEYKEHLLSFRVTTTIIEKIEADAKQLDISPSQTARNIIVRYYENLNARPMVNEKSSEYKINQPDIQVSINQYFNSEQVLITSRLVDKFGH
jgi:hypothetical protein